MANSGNRRCAVAGCGIIKSETDTHITFHRFPGNKDLESKLLRREWIKRCCREDTFDVDNSIICSNHFKDEDFEKDIQNETLGSPIRKILNNHVIPSLNLPYYNTTKIPDFSPSSDTRIKIKHGEFMKNSSKGFNDKIRKRISMKSEIAHKSGIQALGEKLLRVCRTCLKVMRVEESSPLIAGNIKTDLFIKLEAILQMDLFPVENCCLCKNCENFIIATQNFRESCAVNEEVIKAFDWQNKSRNLLHLIDENTLRNKYENCTELSSSIINKSNEENMEDESPDPIIEHKGNNTQSSKKFKMRELESEEEYEDLELTSEDSESSNDLKPVISNNSKSSLIGNIRKLKKFNHNREKKPKRACDIVCKFCGEICHKNSIAMHIKNQHENSSDVSFLSRVGCDICGKKYLKEVDLQRHKQIHHDRLRSVKNVAIKGKSTEEEEEEADEEYLFVEELTDNT